VGSFDFAGFSFNLFDMVEMSIPAIVIFVTGGLLLIAMALFYFKRRRFKSATIKYSDVRIVSRVGRSWRQRYRPVLLLLRLAAIVLFVVAFARPRHGTETRESTSDGIDIMLCLDVSSSMMAEDFKPNNRLFVAKEEIKKFVSRRLNDRIGLVVFARDSYTQCPLTTDYGILLRFIDQVDFGAVEDGTAIGMALANAVNRLRESPAKSKVIVLATDGDNNAGEIDPQTAADVAAAFDIKIYAIGVGKEGNVMMPVQDPIFGKRYVYQPSRIDESTLRQIADKTKGKFYRARSSKELEDIYTNIDKLEKTEIKTTAHIQYRELFPQFVIAGLLLLALEILLANTWLKKLP
jgi:Ca-activated chloride channel family protein